MWVWERWCGSHPAGFVWSAHNIRSPCRTVLPPSPTTGNTENWSTVCWKLASMEKGWIWSLCSSWRHTRCQSATQNRKSVEKQEMKMHGGGDEWMGRNTDRRLHNEIKVEMYEMKNTHSKDGFGREHHSGFDWRTHPSPSFSRTSNTSSGCLVRLSSLSFFSCLQEHQDVGKDACRSPATEPTCHRCRRRFSLPQEFKASAEALL